MMSSNWQHQLEKISERARNILQTGLWSDCAFVVGVGDNQKVFRAHKLILSMSSAVFDRMLNGPLKEQDSHEIQVVDIQPDAFASLLKYIYTDEIDIHSFDQACELCYVANKYMLPCLVQHCVNYIWKDIDVQNACRAYEFAMLFDQQCIAENCKKVILANTTEIIRDASFTEIEKDTLLMILNLDELSICSEIQLFDAAEKWLEAEFERKEITDENEKKELFQEVMSKIRFLSMDPKDFAEGPARNPYFSHEDSYAILMNLVTPTSPVPFPAEFSPSRRVYRDVAAHLWNETCVSWELKYPAEMEVHSQTEYALHISCNKDLEIFGIKVMGNILRGVSPGEEVSLNFEEPHSAASLRGFIENVNTTLCHRVVEKQATCLRENIHLIFPRPYTMSQGKFYRIGVKILKPGLYSAGIFDYDSLLYKALKFNFVKSEIEELFNICGIICKQKT